MVTQTVALGAVLLLLVAGAPRAFAWMGELIERVVTLAALHDPAELLWPTAAWLAVGAAGIGAVVVAAAALGALVGAFAQVRGVFSLDPVKPRFDRMNPGENLKTIFSTRQLFELAKTVLKLLLLCGAFVALARSQAPNLLRTMDTDLGTALGITVRLLLGIALSAWLASLVLSALDYGIQHFEFMKKQRMSLQDLRYEHKDVEGDPMLRAQRKRLHRSLSQAPLKQQVERASVVVANPTHIAVGLHYERGAGDLPRVVVKGSDALALEIRRLAEAAAIPVVRSVTLARALYAQVEEEDCIGEEFFDAVAAVLAAAGQAMD
jgi:flagellar biosynthesis protein FlhB